ncbi:dTDP-4-dehydrorhamnose 3,5-epimerase family protein [Crossiella cryophila]|uniref:NDP-hexose 3,5-(Or5-) epimerase n=1 Tax=Crossiella cryophila TaxID=43355 RepID=A0A7W7CBW7_9PSEU|nr:dTDP-4-dehydrorhamnose 3,5-epimerase family protein [Crossiella cryophila]MBB4678311.1 NDP-hexose 3,5-(Or5-) epimerase [Crossiella cryophila]
MKFHHTELPGALVITPEPIADERGSFFENLRTEALSEEIGRPFRPAQINYSVSRRNTLRGLHGVRNPPGQAKYVTCVRGALRDIMVDLRLGSPAYGKYVVTELTAAGGTALYIPEGFGHGFLSLTDDTCISYVLGTAHVPGTQIDINPLDPELNLPWGFDEFPLISAKDAAAPTLAEVRAQGLLLEYTD